MNSCLSSTILLGMLISVTNVLPAIALRPNISNEIAQTNESEDNVASLVASAQEKINKGDYQGARQDLNKAIELSPRNPKLFALRGIVYFSLERYERAIQDYDTAISLDPQTALYYDLRGQANLGVKQYEAAIADYSRVIAIDPSSAKSYIKRGQAYKSSGNGEKALADFNKAIALSPNDADAYYYRGVLYFDASKQSSEEKPLIFISSQADNLRDQAMKDYNQAIKLNARVPLYYYSRGILHGLMCRSLAGNIFRTDHYHGSRNMAIQDLKMAAKLFADAGDKASAEAAISAAQTMSRC
jgi:tetratricopeptide (TPR) repeat protein